MLGKNRRQSKKARIEELERRIIALEGKLAPTVSNMTSGKDKPLTTAQIIDEWVNGKKEGENT